MHKGGGGVASYYFGSSPRAGALTDLHFPSLQGCCNVLTSVTPSFVSYFGPLRELEPLLTYFSRHCRVCWDPFTSVTSSDVSYFYQVFYYPELQANISSRAAIASPVTSKILSAVGPSRSVEITNVSLTVGTLTTITDTIWLRLT